MRLLRIGRQRIEIFLRERASRLDRKFLCTLIPRKIPSLTQLQHIDLFLDTWERRVIGAAGTIALIAFGGIIFSIWSIGTIKKPTTGGTIQEVLVGTPQFINPIFAASDADRTLTNTIFLPLCDSFERDIPKLAAHCEITDDKRAVITLTSGRVWEDGEPVTVDDVKFTLETMQNPATQSPWEGLARRLVIGTDSNGALIINTKQPTPELRTLLSLGIIPKHVWAGIEPAKLRSSALNTKPVGNGAYKLDQLLTDRDGIVQNITLAASETFTPRRAYIDTLDFRIVDDESSARELFRTRQIDSIFLYDPTNLDELVKRDVHHNEIVSTAVVSLLFNPVHNQLLRKQDFRMALALTIDRSMLVKKILAGSGVPTRAPFPLSMLREPSAQEPEENSAMARELFKKVLGTNTSTTLQLGVPLNPEYEAVAENIRATLAPYNINVQTGIIDSVNGNDNLLSMYDMVLLGQDYGPIGNPAPFWHSSASGSGGGNYARYQVKEVDSLLENLSTESTPATRTKLLDKITARLVTDVPAVFLYQPVYNYYTAGKIQNVILPNGADATERFEKSFDWYLKTTRARKTQK